MKRKIVTLLLSVALAVTSIVPAFADEIVVYDTTEEVSEEVIYDDASVPNEVSVEKEEAIDEAVKEEAAVAYVSEISEDKADTKSIEEEPVAEGAVISEVDDNADVAEEGAVLPGSNKIVNGYESAPEKNLVKKQITSKNIDGVTEDGVVLPEKYDVLDQMTSSKSQGNYGNCWANTMVSIAENSMIRKGYADKSEVKYSRRAMGYFLNSPAEPAEPLGGFEGDGNHRRDGKWWDGNNAWQAGDFLMGWRGITSEGNVPYSGMPALDDEDNLVRDTTVDEEYAFGEQEAHLTDYYAVEKLDRDAVKEHIMTYGAGAVAFYSVSDESDPILEALDIKVPYNPNNPQKVDRYSSYYIPYDTGGTNHSVTLVGWDDNFPKEKFNPDNPQPEKDGAWLIRNSWYDLDRVEYAYVTYFWMSYEDQSLGKFVLFFDFDKADNYDHNYQYDGDVYDSSWYSQGKVASANVFEVKANQDGEVLEAISYDGENLGMVTSIDVYLNPDLSNNDPTNGLHVAHADHNRYYYGYQTVKLDNPVVLSAGDTYSIVTTTEGEEDALLTMVVEGEGDEEYFFACKAGIKKGQSYAWDNEDGWVDLYDVDYDSVMGNCKIKGYTNDAKTFKVNYHSNAKVDSVTTVSMLCSTKAPIFDEFFFNDDMIQTGWNTKADGSGTSYKFGEEVNLADTVNSTVDLYAVWQWKEGWHTVDGKKIYTDAAGEIETGWVKFDNEWYYLGTEGIMTTGWQKVNNKWYYLKDTGAMATGWVKDAGKWYYLKDSGAMATGWILVGGKWYYHKANGHMLTGWQKVNNKWYYLKDSGAMATGWVKDGDKWYYLSESGAMATGWIQSGNKWYYLNSNGAMVTGWQVIGGKRYYFNDSGAMQTGYKVLNGEIYRL